MGAYKKEIVDFIENNRLKYNTIEMAKLLQVNFKKNITTKALRKYYYRHNLDFKKIYDKKYNCVFSKEIGFESPPDKNGLIRIKINNKQWQYKQRYLYEKYNNVKLSDDEFVIFADGDKTNFNKDNLIVVKKETARTFYCLTKGEIKNKELTKIGLNVAEIKNKLGGLKC